MRAALASGHVVHHRTQPREHRFRYRVGMALLPTDCLNDALRGCRWWSAERANLVSLYRSDYLPGPGTIADQVRKTITDATGDQAEGDVWILTQPRSFGYAFNPVSFYAVYHNGCPTHVVAEITNTPWGERHRYAFRLNREARSEYDFAKSFHISPFLPLNVHYHWSFDWQDDRIAIDMTCTEPDTGKRQFSAHLRLTLQPWTAAAADRFVLSFPAQTARTLIRIYWQAFRLWLKRTPIYDHPPGITEAEPAQHGDEPYERHTRRKI